MAWCLTSIVFALLLIERSLVVGQESCGPVTFKQPGPWSRPLLYGGLYEQGRVVGGTPRDSFWGKVCSFKPGDGNPATCTMQQAAKSFVYARSLGDRAVYNFTPCDLIPYLRGRTLWVIGDSHAKTFFRALQCFLIDFWGQRECATSTNPALLKQLENLPAAPGQNYCVHLTGPAGGRICLVHVVLGSSLLNSTEVANGGVLPLLRNKFAKPQDIFYINFNIWHKKLLEWQQTYRSSLEALGQYYQATKKQWPHMLFRETPAEHPRNATLDGCVPARGWLYDSTTGNLLVDPAARQSALNANQSWTLGLPFQRIAKATLDKYGIPVVPALNITVPLWDNHTPVRLRSGWIDCMHYCHPGVPEMWVWYFYQALSKGQGNVVPLPDKAPTTVQESAVFPCWELESVA